ncbi:hypothetical protein [Actinotalea subterranea]|uniref:hypothetical protein n=1 Tax=Actinotalea subterranea TaxID=2607497 RepID=UPI00165DF31B|nr:hypothetical protein [Actinotalea subterranea]
MRQLTTDVLAAATLFLGFVVADVSGVRALGAVVLVGGLAWCVLREVHRTAWWRLVVVALIGVGCFVAAHLLADALGGYPAAGLAAVALGLGAHLLVVRAGGAALSGGTTRASDRPTTEPRPR